MRGVGGRWRPAGWSLQDAVASSRGVGPDVLYSLYTVFLLSYGVAKLDLSKSQVLSAVLIGSACQLVTIPLAGWLSDRVNRRLLYALVAVATAVWVFVMFGLMRPHGFGSVVLGILVAGTCHSFMYGPQAAFVIEQFHPRLRYTGASLAYTFAGILGGALAPLMFTLVAGPHLDPVPVAAYVAGACVLTLVGLAIGRDSAPHEDVEYLTGQIPVQR